MERCTTNAKEKESGDGIEMGNSVFTRASVHLYIYLCTGSGGSNSTSQEEEQLDSASTLAARNGIIYTLYIYIYTVYIQYSIWCTMYMTRLLNYSIYRTGAE